MKKTTQLLLLALALVFTTSAIAQSTVTGTIMDSELNAPLPGANILEKGTTNGVSTDFDGKFTLTAQASSGQITISYIGYGSVTLSFNGNTNLGTVTLSPDNSLEEIVVTGTGIIDLAEGRKTSVAVSTIRASEIQKKIGAQDVTMTLVNTPSVYVAGQSGGFGDSRIAVRGFEQDNTAYLLNGQPINGMEDGKMYWSNWSGINDIASAIQIQRGLGSSKLAISSVGGTTNFVTKTTDKREQGFVYAGVANNDYIKTTYQYSTGKSEKGWGASFMLSHWQGDGYNEGNFGAGETYFLSVGYTPNETHNFNFLVTGAPQFHDQNFSKRLSDYATYGRRYNNNWGTYKGQYMTERRNFYHKPVSNINWDYKISEDTNLSTVLYASWGRGGGTGNRGRRIRTAEGRVDYDAIYAYNLSTSGAGGNFAAEGGYVTRSSMNLHSWYGMVSNLETQLSENLSFNVGIDLRTYYGKHFRMVENFHGLTSWQENIRLRDEDHQTFGSFGTYKNVITSRDLAADPWSVLLADVDDKDKIAYNNEERISYAGIFTQLEYATDRFSAFFQGSLSNSSHQRFDLYQYADATLIDGTSPQSTGTPLPAGTVDSVDSEKISNIGYNVKGGLGFVLDEAEENTAYVNAGYYSRPPYQDNIWTQFNNQVSPGYQNETIFGLEAGYSYSTRAFSANVNLYRTSWKDRVVSSSRISGGLVINTVNFGVEQLHSGLEIDFVTRLSDGFKFNGFMSAGSWQYKGTSTTQESDEDRVIISTSENDVDGGEVGDAAQFTLGFGIDVDLAERLSWDADFRFYDKLYADVGAVKENLRLPTYKIVDTGVSYKMLVGKNKDKSVNIRANVNNVFYEIYLSDLRTNIAQTGGEANFKGISNRNQGYFGLGRTWNLSIRYKF